MHARVHTRVYMYILFFLEKSKARIKFSKKWTIQEAYRELLPFIENKILTCSDLSQLKRACVREIVEVGSSLSDTLKLKIGKASSVSELLDTLTEYGSCFDTRLLTAVTIASGSIEAKESLKKFKELYYDKKISNVLKGYRYKIKSLEDSVSLFEKYEKIYNDLTVNDLQHHQLEIENVVEEKLKLTEIKTGCVELTWQLPRELVYRAYTLIKKKYDELSSLAVKSLVCKEADKYAGLPILWRGQEVGVVGPIEPLPEHVRQEPYSLPSGFHWVPLSDIDDDKLVKFVQRNDDGMKNVDNDHFMQNIRYYTTYPNTRHEWQFSIQTTSGKLVGIVLAAPVRIQVRKEMKVFIAPTIWYHRKYENKRLFYMLAKELTRRANMTEVNQFILRTHPLFRPVTDTTIWSYQFNQPTSDPLPTSPRTPGWRRITSKDIPSALALINKWSSQFEIRQVFDSEELAHNFLLQKYLVTYVVEDERSSVTDLVSFKWYNPPFSCVVITNTISTQSSIEKLIIDALVCAKEYGDKAVIHQHNIKRDILESLSFQQPQYGTISFYNYKYPHIAQPKFWIHIY